MESRVGQLWRHRRSGGIALIVGSVDAWPLQRLGGAWRVAWLDGEPRGTVAELELVVNPEERRAWERLA